MNVRYRKTCSKKNNNNKCTLLECQYTKQESANWGHFFCVSFWRRDRHFTWSSEPREGVAACCAKEVPSSFLSYFKTLSNGPAPGIELATYRSALMRTTDWANPSAVKPTRTPQGNFSFHIFSEKKLSHKRILTQTQAYELHMQKMSRVANFVNKPSGTSRYMKKTSARVLFPPHPCPESMLQAMELRKRKCCCSKSSAVNYCDIYLTVWTTLACSRPRDSGEKSFSKKNCEKRAPFPSRVRLIFVLLVLIRPHYTIWEPGTG